MSPPVVCAPVYPCSLPTCVCVLRLAQMCRVHPSDIAAINNPHAVYILGIGINCASQFEIRMGFFFLFLASWANIHCFICVILHWDLLIIGTIWLLKKEMMITEARLFSQTFLDVVSRQRERERGRAAPSWQKNKRAAAERGKDGGADSHRQRGKICWNTKLISRCFWHLNVTFT